ncbi:MAG: LysE family transporter, partial [Rhodobiaceae bacterium]|nr:LysE family transporter [Rhodobiaceae bacterium]
MQSYSAVLLPLAAVWILGVLTPGPNFFATMHMAARHGRRAALLTVAGITVGTSFWALAGFLGIKALFVAVPVAALAIKLGGAAYLVWMGIKMWKSAGQAADIEMLAPTGAFRFGLLT